MTACDSRQKMAATELNDFTSPEYGVSVVIPAFNYARYLPEAIASALAQPYSPLEVIVVDDGSTDETPAVLAGITDPRLRVIRQQNAGLSAARNTGIREARHPFIAFLDADDRWAEGFLPTTMSRFRELPDHFAIVATGSQRMTVDGHLVEQPHTLVNPPQTLSARDFILLNRMFPSAVVARRSVLLECGGFDTELRSSEDRDMWIRITTHHRAAHIAQTFAHIRRHGENMSKNAARMRSNTLRVLGKAWRARAVSRWRLLFWLKARAYFEYQSAWTHFSAGRRATALRLLAISFLLHPIFLRPANVGEIPLFRLRALRHFLLRAAAPPKLTPVSTLPA